jgi:hypothetical protein
VCIDDKKEIRHPMDMSLLQEYRRQRTVILRTKRYTKRTKPMTEEQLEHTISSAVGDAKHS